MCSVVLVMCALGAYHIYALHNPCVFTSLVQVLRSTMAPQFCDAHHTLDCVLYSLEESKRRKDSKCSLSENSRMIYCRNTPDIMAEGPTVNYMR